jgi:hypothetical protein
MRLKPHSGGRKTAHSEELRRRAMELADTFGVVRASRETGIAAGTIRSWRRRQVLAEERDRVRLDGLAHVKAQGVAVVVRGLLERGLSVPAWAADEAWPVLSPGERDAVRAAAEGDGRG